VLFSKSELELSITFGVLATDVVGRFTGEEMCVVIVSPSKYFIAIFCWLHSSERIRPCRQQTAAASRYVLALGMLFSIPFPSFH